MQSCLVMMIELWKDVWKEAFENNKAFRALLKDLSKGFECLCHDLLIAKLHTYRLDISSSNLLQNYLSNRNKKTKVNSFFSSWEDFLSGVSQDSTLGTLLFNIFLCDMFLILKKVFLTRHADYNTPFTIVDYIKDVIRSLGWKKLHYLLL